MKTYKVVEFLRREAHLKDAKKQVLIPAKHQPSQIHIVYTMTNVAVCGGAKIILEHANNIVKYGHRITIVSHFKKPTWFPINKKVNYILVPLELELAAGIPPCDVIVATYWREVYECIAREIAPVVYFEQGAEHLFAWENVSPRLKNYIYKQFQLVPFIYTVSKGAAAEIMKLFNRKSTIINNAIDHSVFYHDTSKQDEQNRDFTVMMIGSENLEFKRISDIKDALSILTDLGYTYSLFWVSPDEPTVPLGSVFVNPEQKQIGNLLRQSDVLVCASLYESFSLPVLEAMACGCSVITTQNKGVVEYAVDGQNCLLVEMNDPEDIAEKIIKLYENTRLRNQLIAEGSKTASRFTWDWITPQIINYYGKISRFKPVTWKSAYPDDVREEISRA